MEAFKKAGGLAFKKKDFKEAVVQFTKAIELDEKNVSLYGNRSVAYLKCNEYEKAIEDADMCIKIQPDWAKGYVRKGNALLTMGAYGEARAVYTEGLSKNPDANMKKQLEAGLKQASSRMTGGPGGPGGRAGEMFSKLFDGMWGKLAMNPETKPLLDDPDVVMKLKQIEKSPNPFSNPALLQDPKISKCLQVLLGVNLGVNADPPARETGGEDVQPMESEEPKPAPKPEPEPEPEPELSEEEKKKKEARAAADAEKDKGNALYKEKKLQEALACYDKAIEIDATNCMYLSNKASVYMYLKDFDKAIQLCTDALKIGNEQNADYKDKGKILTKMAKCYSKKGEYEKAVTYYDKSLREYPSRDAERLLRQTKDYLAKLAKKNYVDPEKSEVHMEQGRTLAKEKKWRPAIDEFTEAYKRDPKNYKALSNRAFVYSKIMDWNNALADCEKCMSMAPDFIKIYLRKARIEMFLKRFHKVLKAINSGLEKKTTEAEKKELMDLKRECMMAVQMSNSGEVDQKRIEEARKDPEIRSIMGDPIIQQVLNKMKDDPATAQRALSDPQIANKLEMLMAAGILRTG